MDLAGSLGHLAEAVDAIHRSLSARIQAISEGIRAGQKKRPRAFYCYFKLVDSLLSESLDEADYWVSEIEALTNRSETRDVYFFGSPDADRLSLDLINDGMRIAPLSENEASEFKILLDEGFRLLAKAIPDLHSELDSLVREVLLARAPAGDKLEFDGASHYQFWGLLILNPRHHKTPLEVIEVLTHEASHSLLFGMTVDEPLVLNPDDELFKSPLRPDLRPMDGIYHAAYVSARMCWAMERMANSTDLSVIDRQRAYEAALKDRQNWEQGIEVMDAHGKLSETGHAILNSAREFMNTNK